MVREEYMLNRNFNFLWCSQIISTYGNKLTIFALPLVGIYVYNTNILETSIITVLSFLPSLLFSTLVGVIVDKGNKRIIGIITNLICFIISIVLFIFSLTKILSLEGFYILIFLLNTCLLFSGISFYSQIPMLVDKNELKRANYKMEISNSIIDTTAPSIAGIIFSVLSAPFIFIIDGVSFILASICQMFISSEVEKNTKKSNKKVVVHIKDAYKYIYKDRLLFVLAISYFMLVFGIGIFQSIQFYYLSKVLEISTTIIGIIISIGNIGLVISSIISFKISEYFGGGKTIIISFFLYALGFLLYYLSDSASVILIVIANILIGAGMPLYNVNASTIRQGKVDISMLGSVSAIWRIFGRGMIPLGATIGGFISTVFSVKFSILISFIVVFISMLVCIFSKELRKYKE